jgi:general secretion pathway protein G
MKPSTHRQQAGFTLIEIMLVVVIIGILMTVVVVKFGGRQEEARINAARADIKNYSTALDLFELDNGFYPSTEQGLQALISRTSIAPEPINWKGPYLQTQTLRSDPWGNPYVYKFPGDHVANSYDLCSFGPGKVGGDEDDICNYK